jgi:hypothetical protein
MKANVGGVEVVIYAYLTSEWSVSSDTAGLEGVL